MGKSYMIFVRTICKRVKNEYICANIIQMQYR